MEAPVRRMYQGGGVGTLTSLRLPCQGETVTFCVPYYTNWLRKLARSIGVVWEVVSLKIPTGFFHLYFKAKSQLKTVLDMLEEFGFLVLKVPNASTGYVRRNRDPSTKVVS